MLSREVEKSPVNSKSRKSKSTTLLFYLSTFLLFWKGCAPFYSSTFLFSREARDGNCSLTLKGQEVFVPGQGAP